MRGIFRRAGRAGVGPARALALASALLAIACAFEPETQSAPSAPAAPTLRVGTSGDYPPFSARSVDGHALAPVAGFDVELAERIAADHGMAVEWVPFRWPELEARVAAGDMDVAMSGVTWRPWRATTGWMTRAVASGGPCALGDPTPSRVAVNRGGVLERFARRRFPDAAIVPLDDNRALGAALADGRADAVVTDSFERAHLGLPAAVPARCEPPADRKVLWVAPASAAELGPRLDDWLGEHEEELRAMRTRWLGDPAPRSDVDHLLDLLARRLAYMPSVAAWKRERGVRIDDPAREAAVLDAAREQARGAGLGGDATAQLFALQIELGKQLQAGAEDAPPEGPALDLGAQIRPELERLGARIVATAARVAPLDPAALDAADWAPLRAQLGAEDCARLRAALLALAPAAAEQTVGAPRLEDAQPSGPSVDERLAEIRRRLEAALDYPPIARRLELEGTAWVRFEIDRAGAAHAVAVSRSSGHDVLDRAALRTVDRAGPLPWVYGRLEVPIRFSLDEAKP